MEKTEKLYYFESKLYSCTANVLEVRERKDGNFDVRLDRTVIFPESGGQLSDTGMLDGNRVLSAYEEGELVWHVVQTAPKHTENVSVETVPSLRLENSRQHTGEHILSGIAKKLFGAVNVGFHMSEEYSTLDFDIPLTNEQICELEKKANEAVLANIPITYELVDAETLATRELRKKTSGLEDRTDEFRIVYIGDVDSCTCCGTHTATTGEVGTIKCTASQPLRGGIRIWFLCGLRALLDYESKQNMLDALAKRFNTNYSAAFDAMLKQGDDLAKAKFMLKQRTQKYMSLVADKLVSGCETVNKTKLVVSTEADLLNADLIMLSEAIFALENTHITALLISANGDNAAYLLRCDDKSKLPANELAKTLNMLSGGKGGGKQTLAQGSFPYKSESQFEQIIEQFVAYVKKAL